MIIKSDIEHMPRQLLQDYLDGNSISVCICDVGGTFDCISSVSFKYDVDLNSQVATLSNSEVISFRATDNWNISKLELVCGANTYTIEYENIIDTNDYIIFDPGDICLDFDLENNIKSQGGLVNQGVTTTFTNTWGAVNINGWNAPVTAGSALTWQIAGNTNVRGRYLD